MHKQPTHPIHSWPTVSGLTVSWRRGITGLVLFVFAIACATQDTRDPKESPANNWWDGYGPVVPHESFPADCTLCHLEGDWHTLRPDFEFNHGLQTGVELKGAHSAAQCLRCHNDRGPVVEFSQQGCTGCHADVHQGRQGRTCLSCHNESSWDVSSAIMDHARTRFPLVGSHAGTACRQCHLGIERGQMEPLSTACSACHGALIAQATNPDHAALGWTTDCERCHLPTEWGGGGFTHSTFPLTGAHARTDCSQCHIGDVYQGTPRDCFSCHTADYQATTNPNHTAAGFSTSCESCHNTSSWEGARYNHTTYPLTGAHTSAACSQCHLNDVFQGTARDCAGCHLPDYQGTTDPNHVALGYSTSCENCHNTFAWEGANINHDFFPLLGAHATTACQACHVGNVYQGTPNTCVGCHQADYQGTTDPNHVQLGYSTSCEGCHNTTNWNDANFNHNFFPLLGAHASTACDQCHVGGVFQGTPTTCVGCHQNDYNNANDPDHAGFGFPTTCQDCHNTSDWDEANFQHSFPIT
ncbi:MAG TPA: hypothetical protein PLJ12_12165, partial [Planctomycetota bacterium]|nr:hypothetical protein [Planctomycetota bacterium]